MAMWRFLPVLVPAFALAACGGETEEPETITAPADEAVPESEEGSTGDPIVSEELGATPLEERVATIGLLNKRNNVSQDFELRPGESVEEGPVILTLATCERTAPWEMPQETGAFVQVDIRGRGQREHTRVFSGWLYKESPSLNVVEHPIYDVWVKDCAMSFPGDE